MSLKLIISIILVIFLIFCCVSGRFPLKYEHFCAVFVANHIKTRNRRSGVPSRGDQYDDSKMCPLALPTIMTPIPNIHDALANMRRLDGSPAPHDKYGPPVNFFAPKGSRKYWISKRTPILGYVYYINYFN